jgi:hypothetical protein
MHRAETAARGGVVSALGAASHTSGTLVGAGRMQIAVATRSDLVPTARAVPVRPRTLDGSVADTGKRCCDR